MASTPQIIDLYSGVGGLSLGAAKAGFEIKAAVEMEERALKSHAANFPTTIHLLHDISKLTGKKLVELAKMKRSELAGLVGGPPCQGFSYIGKQDLDDSRNRLFIQFFKLVSEVKPVFYLAENVPGIMNPLYDPLRSKALRFLQKDYISFDPILLTASDFGAATKRTRVFFIGVRKDISGCEDFSLHIESLKSKRRTYVSTALRGLPEEISNEWLTYKDSWRRLIQKEPNGYLVDINKIIDKVGNPEAVDRYDRKSEVSGCFGTRHTPEILNRYQLLRPGEQDKISKSIRLQHKGLCPTLRAGTDNTKGSFQAVRPIHPTMPRVITPREAARLQGFPDWFQFHETKWHSFRQIGNSVCPLLGEKVLSAIRTSIKL